MPFVCRECFLVQLPNMESREHIFNDEYAYFSSYSQSVLDHARGFVEMMTERFGFGPEHRGGRGRLERRLPAAIFQGKRREGARDRAHSGNVSPPPPRNRIPSRVRFFGVETATDLKAEGFSADLIYGANVMAHVPDINDFVGGFPILLAPEGVLTIEFPHLLKTLDELYYDQIYHEHYSYLSFHTVERSSPPRLTLFDVDEIKPQGGSLRVYASMKAPRPIRSARASPRCGSTEYAEG